MISIPFIKNQTIFKTAYPFFKFTLLNNKLTKRNLNSLNNLNTFNPLQNKQIYTNNKFFFSTNPSQQQTSKSFFQKFINHPYSRLCRYEKPIGAYLLYWPCAWGVATASLVYPSLYLLTLFFMGAWTSRSAGCIINDLFDKDFDKRVQRTKTRPLASGQVSSKQAFILLFLNLCGGLYVLTQMPLNSILATFCILPVAGLYPLAKRYTNYPQFVLGLAFNSGTIICALAVQPFNPQWITIIPLYISGILWTLVYDTVYAYQDIDDDLMIGVKSTAITWRQNNKQIMSKLIGLSGVCFIFMGCFNLGYLYSLPLTLLGHYGVYYKLKKLDLKDKQTCLKFFKNNSYFGAFILFSIVFGKIVAYYLTQDKNQNINSNNNIQKIK